MDRLTEGLLPYAILTLLCLALFVPGQAAVPVLDRDESRFVQASQQMLESGDLVDIRFQDEPRHRKPVGIYWLQAASVALLGPGDGGALWPYRLPSLLGALVAVLLTFALGRALVGRQAALIGAGLLAVSVVVVTEAHIAKTDAVLLACAVAAQGALGRMFLAGRTAPARPGLALPLLFWGANGIAVLIKGPIVPMISALTVLALVIAFPERGWLARLRAARGLPLALALVAPWAIAIGLATDGAFYREAIGGDLLAKVASGQESHGAPPGYFAAVATLTFWPASLLLWPALVWAVGRRHEPGVGVCLAWLVPAWLVFELVPTKLPHYTMPLYPALALLVGAALVAGAPVLRSALARGWAIVWAAAGLALAGALMAAPIVYGGGIGPFAVLAALGAGGAAVAGAVLVWRRRPAHALAAAVAGAAITLPATFGGIMPALDRLWVADRVAAALAVAYPEGVPPVVSAGFTEPSLVFRVGTGTVLTGGEGAADVLVARPEAVALVEGRQREAFAAAVDAAGIAVERFGTVRGFNYSKGREVEIALVRRAAEDKPARLSGSGVGEGR